MQVRITSVNKVRNYISYAVALLDEKGHSSVVLKAMGQAINKAVVVGEYPTDRTDKHGRAYARLVDGESSSSAGKQTLSQLTMGVSNMRPAFNFDGSQRCRQGAERLLCLQREHAWRKMHTFHSTLAVVAWNQRTLYCSSQA